MKHNSTNVHGLGGISRQCTKRSGMSASRSTSLSVPPQDGWEGAVYVCLSRAPTRSINSSRVPYIVVRIWSLTGCSVPAFCLPQSCPTKTHAEQPQRQLLGVFRVHHGAPVSFSSLAVHPFTMDTNLKRYIPAESSK